VPADPKVMEREGGGLTDRRSVRRADGNGVTMFLKRSDRTRREHRR